MLEFFKLVKSKANYIWYTNENCSIRYAFRFSAANASCQDSDPYLCPYWLKAPGTLGNSLKCKLSSLRGKQFYEN